MLEWGKFNSLAGFSYKVEIFGESQKKIYDVFVQYFKPCLYLGWYTSYSQKGTQLLSIQLHELSSHLGQHLGSLLVNPHVCS